MDPRVRGGDSHCHAVTPANAEGAGATTTDAPGQAGPTPVGAPAAGSKNPGAVRPGTTAGSTAGRVP